MAAPLNTTKQTVDLAAPGSRGSRIRRDPPPKPKKELTLRERDARDTRIVVVGIVSFTLAMFVILVGVSSYLGWSPRQYVIDIEQ